MQIIQTIRDKGAAIVIAVIALSLIGFILMDAKQGSNRFFSSLSSNIGKVDGEAIEKGDFESKVKIADQMGKQQASQSGRPAPDLAQVREQVWNQMVAERVFYAEAAKLGIGFTSKELSAVLNSNDPSNPLMQDQSMVDPNTGMLDETKVANAINTIKKAKGEQFDMINNQIAEPQKIASVSGKYFALLNASAYYPGWMLEKDKVEAENFANISLVNIPYNVISDSTVKISDDEISAYVQKHKNQFKQEAGRLISYVSFSQAPSSDDSAKTKEYITGLKETFTTDNNSKAFIARNGSVIDFDTNYLPKAKINSSYIDTIVKQPTGTVYGPYVDQGSYVLAKLIGSRSFPDSLKARHILVPTVDPKTGQPIIEDSVAKNRADSILNAIKSGGDFVAMAKQFGTDATKDKGGDLGYFGFSGPMVEEFNTALFGKPVGTREVIRSRFGYHVIEITGEKGSSPAYKIAFMAKEIMASDVTVQNANLGATKLSAQKTTKDMDAYLAKNGLQKVSMPVTVKENDSRVGQFQDARQLVRWVFEAKQGDVSEPFNIDNNQFVVAIVDKIESEGTQDVKTARPMAEVAIRNQKKAEQIIAKIGANPTLEAAAAAYASQVVVAGADSSITFNAQIIPNVGPEPKVIGASFNKEFQSKASAPFAGATGVFVIKVNSIGTKTAESPEQLTQLKAQKLTSMHGAISAGWFEGLKEQASIKDYRSKFF